jgi:hypothetical protein
MPVPVGQVPPDVARYLEDLEARLGRLEDPQEPVPVPAYTTALMPAAASFMNRVLRNTTLNILAVSDGTNWKRQDTGASI